MIIRTFNNPTNIFLIGDQVKYGKNYGLTDDFSGLDLNIGEDYSNIETTGHFSILTEKELYNYIIDTDYLSKINETYHFAIYDECGIIFIKNYIGNIEGILLDEFDKEIDFTKKKYINWVDSSYSDFSLKFSKADYENLSYEEFIEKCKMINIVYSREKKINNLLK